MTVGEDFCGEYKGTHEFEPGENSCRCGRAFKRAPRPLTVRETALRNGRTQWGCAGRHSGPGSPDCPVDLHHHHDLFCQPPTPQECRAAGVKKPPSGWDSRA